MALADGVQKVKDVLMGEDATTVPQSITDRMKRGKTRKDKGRSERKECIKFWDNDQYVYRSGNALLSQATTSNYQGGGKPRHRARTKQNLITDVVQRKVSAATQRVPSYEVDPSTQDPEDVGAAKLAGKVARYGYDEWGIRRVTELVVTSALVADSGFAWPHWDSSVGPFMDDGQGGVVGRGEVAIEIFTRDQVYWEPGVRFEKSRWYGIDQAMTPEQVKGLDGYNGVTLKPDSKPDDMEDDYSGQAKLINVTHYLERPCSTTPNGRWLVIANQKQIVPEKPYPCQDEKGNVIDEPVLHKLSYIANPFSDEDRGLVRLLIDAQRIFNNMNNKQQEWVNLTLNPQIIIQNGEFKQQITDEPGAVYHATGTGEIKVREVPNIPGELSEIKQEMIETIGRISAQNDLPSGVSAQGAIQALLDADSSREAGFISALAEFHSRLMRHCLYLVQRFYTEERLLKIRGRYGPETIEDFLGSQLLGQADVTVLPGSVTPRTRDQITTQVMNYAQLGWVTPEQAMAAIDGGTAEGLIDSYEQDQARANLIIQKILAGPEVLFAEPSRPALDGEDAGWIEPPQYQEDQNGQPVLDQTGQPIVVQPGIPNTEMPGWMPRPFDNAEVQLTVFSDWLKTALWDQLDPDRKKASMLYYQALLKIKAQDDQQAMAAQNAQAEQYGLNNASKPQTDGKQNPSLPGSSTTPPPS